MSHDEYWAEPFYGAREEFRTSPNLCSCQLYTTAKYQTSTQVVRQMVREDRRRLEEQISTLRSNEEVRFSLAKLREACENTSHTPTEKRAVMTQIAGQSQSNLVAELIYFCIQKYAS
jgi:hypothetical protein